MIRLLLFILFTMIPSMSLATTRYVDITLASDCTSGDYNISARACTGTDGNAYNTIAKGVTPTVAGDTLYLRGGTYPTNQRIDLQLENKSGTASAYMTIAGFPGDSKPVLQYTEGSDLYGNIKARGNRGWLIFEDLVLDGTNMGTGTGWQIRDGNHDFIVRRLEIKNQMYNGIYFDNITNVLVEDNYIHDARTTCIVGQRYHGFYIHHGTNITIRRNKVEHMPGLGGQLFPGPWDGVTITGNVFIGNNHCTTTNNGGFTFYASSGNISNVTFADNVVAHNGYAYNSYPGGAGGGIRVLRNGVAGYNFTNTKLYNNVIVDNTYNPDACTSTPCPDHEQGNAISILSGVTGVEIKNNILTDNTTASVVNYGTVTLSNNACKSGESCGTTGKLTVAASTDCIISLTDWRLKQGTNVCRNAGTSVTSRSSPVGVTDIGAYEQGSISSASVVAGYIELVASVMTPALLPSTGVTGATITCVGCTGTPVASAANVKSGSDNIIQLTVSGITANGTCTVSLGSTNLTDSLFVGGPNGSAQGLNSVSGLSVSGTCQNTAGGGGGVTASWSHFPLNEGSGTVANDDTGLAHHGTVSSGVTWVNDSSGTGVSIPTDATYRHVASTYGSAINPSTQNFAACALVKLDSTAVQKVVFSSGTNGTNQRWYAGVYPVAGQPQWGIGIQGSGFTTGSEFVATTQLTFLCLVNDSAADTATLWINGVKGSSSGTSVKSLTSYTLTGNLVAGNDGTNTVNNGGFTVYDFWVWNTKPTDQDIVDLYASLTPTSGTSPCLAQTKLQWEYVYTDSSLAPVSVVANADESVDVVPNGGVAFRVQYTCTGSASDNVALRLYYSLDGVTFSLPVPAALGLDKVAAWGDNFDTYYNDGISSGCIDATGLTPNSGVTVAYATASPTFSLGLNHCRTDRYIVRVGNTPNTSIWFRLKTDAGLTFANGYAQTIKINITESHANGGM